MIAKLMALACAGVASVIPGCGTVAPEPVGIEHVVFAGDEGNIGDVSPPDTITVRWPGADPTDEAWYSGLCDDMGGRFVTRDFGDGTEAACERIDY